MARVRENHSLAGTGAGRDRRLVSVRLAKINRRQIQLMEHFGKDAVPVTVIPTGGNEVKTGVLRARSDPDHGAALAGEPAAHRYLCRAFGAVVAVHPDRAWRADFGDRPR